MFDFNFLIIDKPSGPTSHEITAFVRKLLNVKKAGHSGTLDPIATGVLPVCLSKSTKLLEFIQKKDKQYVCVARFSSIPDYEVVSKALQSFIGKNYQIPPKQSAVKRQLRTREIYSIDLLELKQNLLLFKVHCEAGTYIRVLCNQLGDKIGIRCEMLELRRISSGKFTENQAVQINDLIDAHYFYSHGKKDFLLSLLRPISELIDFPKVYVKNNVRESVFHGSSIYINAINSLDNNFEKGDFVSVYDEKGLVSISIPQISSLKIKDLTSDFSQPVFKTYKYIGEHV